MTDWLTQDEGLGYCPEHDCDLGKCPSGCHEIERQFPDNDLVMTILRQFTMSERDKAMIEYEEHTRRLICQMFGLPPSLLDNEYHRNAKAGE